ncbi:TIGR02594 family protein [Shimia sp. R9_2]|uniref:TIGR02594 family protein n=1 Tax=Shimia sp. R9_2 TaxID=2821112 RepID=UPI001ADA9836|nr:TIGR02594 family protein [Shimia sp. R9_2]MBO9396368.1 TIGR02594 family protein [Shimia sp. R9_2]
MVDSKTNEQKLDADRLTQEEIGLRKYEAKISLLKVVWGTAAVGILSVLVPGAIEFWSVNLEKQRLRAQAEFEREKFQYETRRAFMDTALNQDIELRLRFASYLSKTLSTGQSTPWHRYEEHLEKQRSEKKLQIHELERQLRKLIALDALSVSQQIELAELERKLEWSHKEIGYVERNRSVVKSKGEQESVETSGSGNSSILTPKSESCRKKYSKANAIWHCIASEELGVREVAGPQNNPRIMGYAQFLDLDYTGDDIPWSGLFVAWVVAQSGKGKLPNIPLGNRSWLEFGSSTDDPQVGDIAIFWRENRQSWKGHVGFYVGHDETHYHILGGNQSNGVNIRRYPRSRLLEFRAVRD